MKFDSDLEGAAKLAYEYGALYDQFHRLTKKVERERLISDQARQHICDVQSSLDLLHSFDEPHPKRALLLKLQSELETEVPVGSLWWPEKKPAP